MAGIRAPNLLSRKRPLASALPFWNMHRYYRLDVQRDLFGQWCCIW
jgi:hypothetical protein